MYTRDVVADTSLQSVNCIVSQRSVFLSDNLADLFLFDGVFYFIFFSLLYFFSYAYVCVCACKWFDMKIFFFLVAGWWWWWWWWWTLRCVGARWEFCNQIFLYPLFFVHKYKSLNRIINIDIDAIKSITINSRTIHFYA